MLRLDLRRLRNFAEAQPYSSRSRVIDLFSLSTAEYKAVLPHTSSMSSIFSRKSSVELKNLKD